MGSDPQYAKWPLLPLSQHVFTLTNSYATRPAQQSSIKSLQDAISEHKMAPLYKYLAHPTEGILNLAGEGSASSAPQKPVSRKPSAAGMLANKSSTAASLPWDEEVYNKLKAENDKELETFQKEEDDAVEQAGDTEIMAARGKRAEYFAKIGDKDKAITAYEDLSEKTGILGTKIDIVLAIIRLGLFYGDKVLVKKHVARAKALVESGGDWDRRNRLKAYEGLHLPDRPVLQPRGPPAARLAVHLHVRVDFKSKVVDAPEIKAILGADGDDKLSALTGAISAGPGAEDAEMTDAKGESAREAPKGTTVVNLTTLGTSTDQPESEMAVDFSPLAQLVNSLYTGHYKLFFQALAHVEEQFLTQDRYLHEHKNWFIREMRLRAYQQLLQSYRVVGLESMANDFGVTVDFLDRDLAKFIAGGRIPCTIDRVTGKGIIETNRPDDKNKQYQDVVKQGDQLITKLQKYGQAVRLRGSERA
ncbi:putative RPN7-subunit of the regulatory particle of the proteasome [Apiospora arundinis]